MQAIFCPNCQTHRKDVTGYKINLDVGVVCSGCGKVIFPTDPKHQPTLPKKEVATVPTPKYPLQGTHGAVGGVGITGIHPGSHSGSHSSHMNSGQATGGFGYSAYDLDH
jgi:hypothetical protein